MNLVSPTSTKKPIILWFRRDLRLSDHPALDIASKTGRRLIPIFIYDEFTSSLGAAPKWRLALSLEQFRKDLEDINLKLILRAGKALDVLKALILECDASGLYWSRLYDSASVERDKKVKEFAKSVNVEARSFPGHLLHEPWKIEKKQGGFYKVYTPFWNEIKNKTVMSTIEMPSKFPKTDQWPKSEKIVDWDMNKNMHGSDELLIKHVVVGEKAARNRLNLFLEKSVGNYSENRDNLEFSGTSGLSENLTYGEISPVRIWHQAMSFSLHSKVNVEKFLKELVWRDFAWNLAFHTPHIMTENWRAEWNDFPWRGANYDSSMWQKGFTGEPLVDAGMRQMYVTGTMHNRVRMIVASYLTKHLMTHWRIGQDWFSECLIDWDPASNAMGWQWAAGSGPDASPFFRIFNPESQAERFDPKKRYINKYLNISETGHFSESARNYFLMVPKSWKFNINTPYPERIVSLRGGRQRALEAYAVLRKT